MAGAELFGELPQQQGPRRDVAGEPRLREPQRDQIEWRSMDIDSLIGADHPARTMRTRACDLSHHHARSNVTSPYRPIWRS
jgi:hypothetical protein